MIGLLAALMMAAAPAAPAAPSPRACALATLAACPNTNQLVDDRAFVAALKGFFGPARGDYLYPKGPMWAQAQEALHGPPDDAKRLAEGSWLFTACRAHSCPEKGAVILAPEGRVLAVGLLNFRCRDAAKGQDSCDKARHLDIFVRRQDLDAARLIQPLDAWAKTQVAQETAQFGTLSEPYLGLAVHAVDTKAKAPLARK
jgi:hypothetical protein